MATAAITRLKQEELQPGIGSRVLNSKEELLSGELAQEIRSLLEERGVLIFPQLGLTDAEQVAFTKTIGTFAPERTDPDGKEVVSKITISEKDNPGSAVYQKGSLFWHIDGTMNDVPIFASIMSCHKTSPEGTGLTGFANTYSAWDALPEDRKASYEGLRVRHAAWPTLLYWNPEPPLKLLKEMQAIGDTELPLVWEHKSGRKSLVIGNTAYEVIGKTLRESAIILHGLREWATQDQFTYSHQWTVGDMVIWDNTGTIHRVTAYDPDCGRMMHRTKLQGEEAWD
ncbi:MAG: TauD/TfdA family dioxygenase [Rhizorhabdus sp.]